LTSIFIFTWATTIWDVDDDTEGDEDGVPPGAEFVVEALGEFDGDGRFDIDSEGYSEFEGVFDAETPSVKELVGV
jgi:hypothetical protein